MRTLFVILCILPIAFSTVFNVSVEMSCDAAVDRWCYAVTLIEADFLIDDRVGRIMKNCTTTNSSDVQFSRNITYDVWNTETYEIELKIEHNCTVHTQGPRFIKKDFGMFSVDKENVSIEWKTDLTDKGDKSPPKFWIKDTMNDILQNVPL
uniref:Aha1_N domain-containing protein n=2 Tax=Caenorhabditis tropicalis TaxID=1561998 RepID=A0A1I7T8X5_9PELO